MSLLKKLGRGLKTIYQKMLNKLGALRGSRESIAAGFATGVAVSFTPFVGFHICLALIIAKIMHQNGIAATLGTIAGNPWTFPFIWYATLHTGSFLLGNDTLKLPINFTALFKELFHAVIGLDFHAFFSDIWPIIFPMLIGSIPFCIIIGLVVPRLILKVLDKNRFKGEEKDDKRSRM